MDEINPQAWAKFRKPTWEDDISLNHKPVQEFENAPAPCEMDIEDFNVPSHLTEELMGGVTLKEFVGRDTYPMPLPKDREGYNPGSHVRYYLNGLSDFLKIKQVVARHGAEMNSFFDFGCASGRILRHFCCQSDIPRLWGSDINGRHTKWLNDNLPRQLKIIHNNCIPNLQIADNSVDVISAFSVFTHIDTFETAWMAELNRILSPNGLVYLTVHNEDTWSFLQEVEETHALRKRLHDVCPTFGEIITKDLPDDRTDFRYTDVGPYRALVFHSNNYLTKTWGRYFDILEIIPRWHGYYQSIFVGRKRA